MGDLTKNISRYEIACECGCGFAPCDLILSGIIQNTVNYFEKKYKRELVLIITSWNRCKAHNDYLREVEKIPTAKDSFHIKGLAVDFKILTIEPREIYHYLCKMYPSYYGIILYNNRIHFDIGNRRYREDKTNKI